VDDILAKSKKEKYHEHVFKKLFERLYKFWLKLNPIKWSFWVRIVKLLGFVVSSWGIVVDPNKIKAIQDMLTPKMEK
jgi:hypothetical protein